MLNATVLGGGGGKSVTPKNLTYQKKNPKS